MNEIDQRVREVLGRMVAEAPDPVALEDLDRPLVAPGAGPSASRVPGWALAVGGAVVVGGLIVGGVFLSPDTPTAGIPEVVGSPISATRQEFDAAVGHAVDDLEAGPGFEAIQTAFIGEHLSSAVWLDWRPNGDFVSVSRADIDVTETAWWLLGDEPPPDTGQTRTTATVRVGESMFTAGQGSLWTALARPDFPRGSLGLEMALLSDTYPQLAIPEEADITRQGLVGGGEVWAATASFEDGVSVLRWYLDAGGGLEAHRADATGSMAGDGQAPIDSWAITFAPVDDPAPIAEPGEAPLDVDALGLPEEFPLGG